MKIGFIGSGKMATFIIKSIIKSGAYRPEEIFASDVLPDALENIGKLGVRTTGSSSEVVKNSEIVFISVKPQDVPIVVSEILPYASEKLIVSIAAGIPINFLEASLPTSRIVRVMPNMAISVGEGMSVVSKKNSATVEDMDTVIRIFSLGGKVVEMHEDMIDAVTAVSGSGPAYFLRMIECISEAGKNFGLDKKLAIELASQACVGAGKMAMYSAELKDLISAVSSKGGTTEAAMSVFDKENFDKIVFDAVIVAEKRAKELRK